MISESSTLIELLKLVDEVYEENQEWKRGRGRPLIYDELTMLKIFVVKMIKKIKSFKGLHRYLKQNPTVRKYCGLETLPDRRTLGRRLKKLSPSAYGTDYENGREVY